MALSEEDLAQVTGVIQDKLNATVSNLKKTFDLAQSKGTESLKGEIAKLLEDKLKDVKPPEPPASDDKGGSNKGAKDLAISTLQKRLEDAEKAIRESNDARMKAEKRRREIERQNALDVHLAKGGVSDPFMRELAIAHFDRRGYVPDEEGAESALVWRGTDGVDVAFEEGIGSWLKTEEAKRFLPPSGAGGSGGKRPTRTPIGGSDSKKDVTYEDVGNTVMGLMRMPAGLGSNSGE